MKIKYNLQFIGILIVLIGFPACDLNVNEELIEYEITNESDYDIKIIPIASNNYRNPKDQISIRANDVFSESRLWNERFDAGHGFSTFLATDSVHIIIGNQRKIIYSTKVNNSLNNCDDSRNLFRTSSNIGNNRVEYIFKNNDFDCAIVCQDDCI